jgi:hypothetical protein
MEQQLGPQFCSEEILMTLARSRLRTSFRSFADPWDRCAALACTAGVKVSLSTRPCMRMPLAGILTAMPFRYRLHMFATVGDLYVHVNSTDNAHMLGI